MAAPSEGSLTAGLALASSGSLSLAGSPTLSPAASGAPSGAAAQVASKAAADAARRSSRRARFDAGELAIVCSHFDLGVIDTIHEFKRGSSRAPKAMLDTSSGKFLLKRRSVGQEGLARVEFCHGIQQRLADKGFPLPRLVRTRAGKPKVEIQDAVYEIFEYISGNGYDGTLDATGDAGRALAVFHRLMNGYRSSFKPMRMSYHAAPGMDEQFGRAGDRLPAPETRSTISALKALYDTAAQRVEKLGFRTWPLQIIHADWHPGNMLFAGSRVVSVIDYDTARLSPRAIDIANGALQFSITMSGDDPDRWPAAIDEGRFKRFLRGYELVKGSVISTAELEAVPHLMIEALVVEALVPIAATGSFAGLDAAAFLRMVERKARWLESNALRLTALVCD